MEVTKGQKKAGRAGTRFTSYSVSSGGGLGIKMLHGPWEKEIPFVKENYWSWKVLPPDRIATATTCSNDFPSGFLPPMKRGKAERQSFWEIPGKARKILRGLRLSMPNGS